jgi:hypothetical protein
MDALRYGTSRLLGRWLNLKVPRITAFFCCIYDFNNPAVTEFFPESGRHILYDFYTKNSPVLDCKFIKGSSLLFAAGYFKAE